MFKEIVLLGLLAIISVSSQKVSIIIYISFYSIILRKLESEKYLKKLN